MPGERLQRWWPCRSSRSLVIGVVAFSLLTSGCISILPEEQETVSVPEPPGELTASYQVLQGGSPLLNVTVEGFDETEATLGTGESEAATSLRVTYHRPGWRTWDLELRHGEDLESLLQAQLSCEGQETEELQKTCPRNNAETYKLDHRDAAGAPGLLGLGPFLGDDIHAGESGTLPIWDPVDPGTLSWTARSSETPTQKECLSVDLIWEDQSAKTPLPTLPYNRTMRVCEGVPLPVQLSAGPIEWQLSSWKASGTLEQDETPRTPLPETRATSTDCTVRYPSHNGTTLPMRAYMDWAQDQDPIVSSWVDGHPEGFALPSVAKAMTTGEGTTSNAYVVEGMLFLLDPTGPSILSLTMSEEHRRTLVVEESSFEESEHLGSSEPVSLPEVDRQCPTGPISMPDLTQTIEEQLPDSALVDTTFLAPEQMWGLQGLGPWTWPYAGDGWEEAREVFQPPAWPYRGYVTYLPQEMGVGALVAASIDPGGDWMRWIEQDPPS